VAGTAESGGLGSVAAQIAHGAEVAGAERHPDDGAEAGRPPVGVQRRPGIEDAGSHWCLPGVPDAWNELLYAVIVNRFSVIFSFLADTLTFSSTLKCTDGPSTNGIVDRVESS
jgi:hypothetical protein